MAKVFLLLGTNVGNLEQNILDALKELEKHNLLVKKKSRIFKTKPWGFQDQPDFLNLACEVVCDYRPGHLLEVLKTIEAKMGRETNTGKWRPRKIDLDILFYDRQKIKENDLVIPHQHFFQRPFAVKLLAEIAPDFIPPGSRKTIQQYVEELKNEEFEIYRS